MCECHSEGAPATEESGFYSRTLSVVSCLLLTKDKSKTVGTHGWKLFVTLDWLWPVVADVSFVTSLLEKSVPKHLFIKKSRASQQETGAQTMAGRLANVPMRRHNKETVLCRERGVF